MEKKRSIITHSLLIGLMPLNALSMGRLARVGARVSRHPTVRAMSSLHHSSYVLKATNRWQQHQSRETSTCKAPFSLVGAAAAFGIASRTKEKDTSFHSKLDQKIGSLLEQWGFVRGEEGSFSRYDETGVLVRIRIGRHTESFSPSPAILENSLIQDEKSCCLQCSLSFKDTFVSSKNYSDKRIAFMVGHELGHIPHLLDNKAIVSGSAIRNSEHDADIYSTELNGSTEGGIESFSEKILQEQLPQSEKQMLTGAFGLYFLGATLYFSPLVIAAYPILLVGSGSIYKALTRKYPLASERIAHINEYAREQGWERCETEDGQEYYVRP